ncbi:cytochrome c oxidase subunit [Niveomyces insectorum RCEF 264]|uniref:Cytochrome c oxidase subunit n=1 Tax=Niveomyces insectorum RCEF 264 TaxID=1081102 RepID=A0A167W3P6_9HYPO|nr:cytochrome c oxidase subunit [Niveomyces insectorum RCEF 264]
MFRSAIARRAMPAARRFYSAPTAGAAGENAFVRERRAVQEHAAQSANLWRKISIFVCIPALIGAGANAYYLWNEHWEHWSHLPPLEERVEYPYQNIRSKNFSWGDGDKTLFWNDKVNYHKKDKVV